MHLSSSINYYLKQFPLKNVLVCHILFCCYSAHSLVNIDWATVFGSQGRNTVLAWKQFTPFFNINFHSHKDATNYVMYVRGRESLGWNPFPWINGPIMKLVTNNKWLIIIIFLPNIPSFFLSFSDLSTFTFWAYGVILALDHNDKHRHTHN